jgi:hypothetical protein
VTFPRTNLFIYLSIYTYIYNPNWFISSIFLLSSSAFFPLKWICSIQLGFTLELV